MRPGTLLTPSSFFSLNKATSRESAAGPRSLLKLEALLKRQFSRRSFSHRPACPPSLFLRMRKRIRHTAQHMRPRQLPYSALTFHLRFNLRLLPARPCKFLPRPRRPRRPRLRSRPLLSRRSKPCPPSATTRQTSLVPGTTNTCHARLTNLERKRSCQMVNCWVVASTDAVHS